MRFPLRSGLHFSLVVLLACGATIDLGAQSREGVDLLLGKARSLEARGRMDLAVQNWQQVLLVNADHPEALAGLARDAKQRGDDQALQQYLGRLRAVNPKDPAIDAIERMRVLSAAEEKKLDEAGRLAMDNKPDEAMTIYREVFGDEPPRGKWTERYYETAILSAADRPRAIARLRDLSAKDPKNEIYRLWLARGFTHDPKTRAEGVRLLESIRDPGAVEQARTLWRQALLWEQENPAFQRSLEAYVRRYPDQELRPALEKLHDQQQRAAQAADEQDGFEALRNQELSTAETKFDAALRRSPSDVDAIAGLGYVRLNQQRFDEALKFFERASQLAPRRPDVREGHETAKFWLSMTRGASLQSTDPTAAESAYRAALAIRPTDEDALVGVAQSLVGQRRSGEAEAIFHDVLSRSPESADAIAGVATIRLDEKKFREADELFGRAHSLDANRWEFEEGRRTARFWGLVSEAGAALNENRADAARDAYQKALALDSQSRDAWTGLAQAMTRKREHREAAKAYLRVLELAPNEDKGWLGLMKAYIAAGDARAALQTTQRIPAIVRRALEEGPEYRALVALASYRANATSQGDTALKRALALAQRADTEEALNARLEAAGVLAEQGRPDVALSIYTHATKLHPEHVLGWQGIIGIYAQQRATAEALSTLRAMPRATFDAAAKSSGFLDAVASVYAEDGQCVQAERLLTRSLDLGPDRAATTRLQLADIWMRQARVEEARDAYRSLIERDPESVAAWRGYATALHRLGGSQSLVDEIQRMPASVREQINADSGMLSVLAAAYSAAGDHERTAQMLEQARAQYNAQRQPTPISLDIQLAWALLEAPSGQSTLEQFLPELRARADLTDAQQQTVAEVWSAWRLGAAEAAWNRKDASSALTLLREASRELPQDPRVWSTLAGMYMRQREYENAVAMYEAWGMKSAQPPDYEAAAGAALALRDEARANRFLQAGLQRWPDDPALLRIKGREAARGGEYDDAERYLKAALAAAREPRQGQKAATIGSQPPPEAASEAPAVPGCRDAQTGADASGPAGVRLVPATWVTDGPNVENRFRLLGRSSLAIPRQEVSQQQPAASGQPPREQEQPSREQEQPSREQEQTGEIQDEIDLVQHRNTPFLVGFGQVSMRRGDPGIDRLVIRDGGFGGSVTIANTVRLRVEGHRPLLSSGTPTGESDLRFGTLLEGQRFGEQTASGLGGEVQLSAEYIGLAVGTSPHGFLTEPTVTGGVRLGRSDGPISLLAVRDNVKDSLVSYAGARDSGSNTIWGGVISNSVALRVGHDVNGKGGYLSVGYAALRGENVADNWSAEANGGAYGRVLSQGEGGLTIGAHGTFMRYDKNLGFFSFGHGGYFSPQRYYLAAVPITWRGRENRVEYEIAASGGVQHIRLDKTPYFPVRLPAGAFVSPFDRGLFYEGTEQTEPNYNVSLRLNVRMTSYVHLGVFATVNNARDYRAQSVGLTLKVLTQRLPTSTNLRVRSLPEWRGNQPFGY